jgi:hypothetical protein
VLPVGRPYIRAGACTRAGARARAEFGHEAGTAPSVEFTHLLSQPIDAPKRPVSLDVVVAEKDLKKDEQRAKSSCHCQGDWNPGRYAARQRLSEAVYVEPRHGVQNDGPPPTIDRAPSLPHRASTIRAVREAPLPPFLLICSNKKNGPIWSSPFVSPHPV